MLLLVSSKVKKILGHKSNSVLFPLSPGKTFVNKTYIVSICCYCCLPELSFFPLGKLAQNSIPPRMAKNKN